MFIPPHLLQNPKWCRFRADIGSASASLHSANFLPPSFPYSYVCTHNTTLSALPLSPALARALHPHLAAIVSLFHATRLHLSASYISARSAATSLSLSSRVVGASMASVAGLPARPRQVDPRCAASKEELLALIDICQSMHMVMLRGPRRPGRFIISLLNPAELVCTCKGFRMTSNCSHEIAIAALSLHH